MDRALTDRERAVLDWMLIGDFDGADMYRAQIPELRVRGMCGCGCPTIDFVASGAGTGYQLPREGWLRGSPVQISLFARDGVLTMLDLTDYAGTTTTFPDPSDLVETPKK